MTAENNNIKIVFATDHVIDNWETDGDICDELQQGLGIQEFETSKEKEAYIKGLMDATNGTGEGYSILTDEDFEKINNWEDEG